MIDPIDKAVIDDETVRRYFDGVGAAAAAASYMAHERDMPAGMVRYRFRREQQAIELWLATLPPDLRALDLGCGAGAWAELFAERFAAVVAIDRSPAMIAAAAGRLAGRANVALIIGDARRDLPPGDFGLIFLGGVCMYLGDADAVALLRDLHARLAPGGAIILRESTVRSGLSTAQGDYQAVYRSVDRYRALFAEAGFTAGASVRPNDGYTAMVVAGELVVARRRFLPILPRVSPILGSVTWWGLRAIAPLSFRLLPWTMNRLGIAWPPLQNHFFRLTR